MFSIFQLYRKSNSQNLFEIYQILVRFKKYQIITLFRTSWHFGLDFSWSWLILTSPKNLTPLPNHQFTLDFRFYYLQNEWTKQNQTHWHVFDKHSFNILQYSFMHTPIMKHMMNVWMNNNLSWNDSTQESKSKSKPRRILYTFWLDSFFLTSGFFTHTFTHISEHEMNGCW